MYKKRKSAFLRICNYVGTHVGGSDNKKKKRKRYIYYFFNLP